MEWEQLEYFQTLAQMQHVTKAAKSLSITQPALSRSIARLENHLGVPLFDRHGRSITLNQYGHIFAAGSGNDEGVHRRKRRNPSLIKARPR